MNGTERNQPHNGDIVLNEIENIVEWANEHAVIKIAERG